MSKTKQNIFITNNFGETQNLGENFARILLAQAVQGVSLSRDNVVALYGNLGSGKTTFVQGLARGFGIRKRIISPTFVFVRQYKVSPPRCNTFVQIPFLKFTLILQSTPIANNCPKIITCLIGNFSTR